MKKVLLVSNVIAMIYNFNQNNIRILQKLGYQVHAACNLESESFSPEAVNTKMRNELERLGVIFHHIDFGRRYSAFFTMRKAYKQLSEIMLKEKFDFVHSHSHLANTVATFAAHKAGVKNICTVHGFMFYEGAPIINWLLFYPQNWICSWWTDVLITINKEDYKRALKRLHAKRTVYIPGVGVDTAKFEPQPNGRDRIRKELSLTNDQIMLLSVGELNKNKNHEAVIKAINSMQLFPKDASAKNTDVTKVIYVIVGSGKLTEYLKNAGKQSGVDVRLMGYRTDVADFYDAADVYILPSLREGLNVSLMEAMASGLAVACGRIRGNTDLIDEIKENNCFFDPGDKESVRRAIEYCITHRRELGQRNLKKIRAFDFKTVGAAVDNIYSTVTPPPHYHSSLNIFLPII